MQRHIVVFLMTVSEYAHENIPDGPPLYYTVNNTKDFFCAPKYKKMLFSFFENILTKIKKYAVV